MKRTIAALALALTSLGTHAQQGTIKFLVGFPAGASLDAMTRMVAEKMQASLGQNVIVENRAGAAGQIAMNALKTSPADGTVLVMTPLVTVVTAPHIQKLPYDPFADFAPVAHTADFLFAFAMGPATPAKSLKEYVGLVKQDAKYGNYASAATGSLPHFFSLLFAEKAGLKMNHIGYRGTAAAMTDLLGGQIAAFMGTVSDVAPQHKAGKIVAVATSGATRSKHLPDIPTFKELGYDIEGGGWYAAYAPAGTPAATIDRLSKAIIAALKEPDVRQRLDNYGMEPSGLGPAELARIHKRDYDLWGPVIKASGFKPGS
ncbi:MAG: Bug family tripartite tricarboxylate transporter substrate binding protein [Betaproteobacteria bacterium]|nr:Bug family tripartite tricarboxylate transporter substrate binding protein [Betaproteobacteria bacterium]MDH5221618.1 Bug family tripartite tricarboxylate transporter substrate binding protein [Betaproteobacteria bacterium]MDH5352008.1 Bug family tripartite tricarboxylate transporter substrate binding protein [Betaproteobacteria bacterium]